MELPLEALQLVSEAAPPQGGQNHCLIFTPETGFLLYIWVNGQAIPFNFDYGDTIDDIKEQISAATGIMFIDAGMEKKSSINRLAAIRSRASYEMGPK